MITVDLGNSMGKVLAEGKKIIDSSNVQAVEEGTFGAYKINGKNYLFGEGAKAKKDTNKIKDEKKALLAKILYSIVEDNADVNITTLLPLSLYIKNDNKEMYKEMLKGDYVVENPNGAKKSFKVTDIEVCAEGFSSLITDASLLKKAIYLVDIGGVDVSGVLVNRTPVMDKFYSTEQGMNIFFSELAKILTSELLESYSDKDAKLLYEKYDSLADGLKNIIDKFSVGYINTHIYQNLKNIGYKSIVHQLVFVGGGSEALRRYIERDTNAIILDNAIWSNVEGASIISKRRAK